MSIFARKASQTQVEAAPREPYVKIQRTGEREYSLELKDPNNWLALKTRTAKSHESATSKAEEMLREYAREQGYERETWTVTLKEGNA